MKWLRKLYWKMIHHLAMDVVEEQARILEFKQWEKRNAALIAHERAVAVLESKARPTPHQIYQRCHKGT